MSGNSTWAIVGPIVAVVGMLVVLFGIRRRDALVAGLSVDLPPAVAGGEQAADVLIAASCPSNSAHRCDPSAPPTRCSTVHCPASS